MAGGGRHNWNNAEFDDDGQEGGRVHRRSGQRIQMFQDAEKLLVTDVGGVFIYHRTIADLYKPYLKGTELEPDKNGFAAIHWPAYANMSTVVRLDVHLQGRAARVASFPSVTS